MSDHYALRAILSTWINTLPPSHPPLFITHLQLAMLSCSDSSNRLHPQAGCPPPLAAQQLVLLLLLLLLLLVVVQQLLLP